MKRKRLRSKKFIFIALLSIFALFVQSVSAFADENEMVTSEDNNSESSIEEGSAYENSEEAGETDEYTSSDSEESENEDTKDPSSDSDESEVISEILPTEEADMDVISVDLPTVSEDGDSPFDFILDPQFLIYETEAAMYGGGRVEEGAPLLFRNHDGEYDFSRNSDKLTIKNKSNVPVRITVKAVIDNLGDIGLSSTGDFDDSDRCELYLALIDDEGNEMPLSDSEETRIEIEMEKAPEDAYTYRLNDETGSYEYNLTREAEEIDFDTYSFGLTGNCNPNGAWEDVYVNLSVRLTWEVESILSEKPTRGREDSLSEKKDRKDSDSLEEDSEETKESSDSESEETDKEEDSNDEIDKDKSENGIDNTNSMEWELSDEEKSAGASEKTEDTDKSDGGETPENNV